MTQTADFDHNIFSTNHEEADRATLVKFIVKSMQDSELSKVEGRPIFKEVEYIEIRIAGNRTDFVCRPATWRDKERFPRHYDAFKKRIEMPVEGTPLTEWAQITRSQAEELSFHSIKTVEQLSAVSDAVGQNFMGFQALRNKAKQFLETSKEDAGKQELKDALTARDNRIEELENRVNSLIDKLETPTIANDKPQNGELKLEPPSSVPSRRAKRKAR